MTVTPRLQASIGASVLQLKGRALFHHLVNLILSSCSRACVSESKISIVLILHIYSHATIIRHDLSKRNGWTGLQIYSFVIDWGLKICRWYFHRKNNPLIQRIAFSVFILSINFLGEWIMFKRYRSLRSVQWIMIMLNAESRPSAARQNKPILESSYTVANENNHWIKRMDGAEESSS